MVWHSSCKASTNKIELKQKKKNINKSGTDYIKLVGYIPHKYFIDKKHNINIYNQNVCNSLF